ncbi:MAG: hypothetical protein MUW56_14425 [Chryseobacterium sp.]|nr:hypothetical protein [Chryseobacterium sp.]MCJ7934782.1 hypothetical protein [Chryseobacterium sp.]
MVIQLKETESLPSIDFKPVFESEISLETHNLGLQNSNPGWISPIKTICS